MVTKATRSKKVKTTDRNGTDPSPIKHRPLHITELEKPKLVKINSSLARKFRDMERYPNDRNLQPNRCEFLRTAIRANTFRGSEWVSASLPETDKIYRMNGKHTSNVIAEMYEAQRKFPSFISWFENMNVRRCRM